MESELSIWMAIIILLYMLPMMIAFSRQHHNASAIGFLTLLAGWTVIGWLVAFIWSLTAVRIPEPLWRR